MIFRYITVIVPPSLVFGIPIITNTNFSFLFTACNWHPLISVLQRRGQILKDSLILSVIFLHIDHIFMLLIVFRQRVGMRVLCNAAIAPRYLVLFCHRVEIACSSTLSSFVGSVRSYARGEGGNMKKAQCYTRVRTRACCYRGCASERSPYVAIFLLKSIPPPFPEASSSKPR